MLLQKYTKLCMRIFGTSLMKRVSIWLLLSTHKRKCWPGLASCKVAWYSEHLNSNRLNCSVRNATFITIKIFYCGALLTSTQAAGLRMQSNNDIHEKFPTLSSNPTYKTPTFDARYLFVQWGSTNKILELYSFFCIEKYLDCEFEVSFRKDWSIDKT